MFQYVCGKCGRSVRVKNKEVARKNSGMCYDCAAETKTTEMELLIPKLEPVSKFSNLINKIKKIKLWRKS